MTCSECSFVNRPDVRFCEGCGAALTRQCPSCSAKLPPDRAFCGECGTRLDPPAGEAAARSEAAPEPAEDRAERRQLSVMFCDMVGSTAMSEALDPEDMRELNRAYQQACEREIRAFGGYVARYMGDGVLAYFGYPDAHEDDAERAAHAALGMVGAVAAIPVPAGFEHLAVRVGIATGTVVVGDVIGEGAARERAAVGRTPNLAARLQGLANPGTVVVDERTHRLLGASFEYDDLGVHTLKGIVDPIHVWRVAGAGAASTRFEAHHAGALTSLVGRTEELELLERRWAAAVRGEGQIVLIEGEPGIGKSRLTHALREHVEAGSGLTLRLQCSPFSGNSAFHPFLAHLERAARLGAAQDAVERLGALEALLGQAGGAWREHLALLAPLLAVDTLGRYRPTEIEPARQRTATVRALADQIAGLCGRQPVLLIFEDAHWVDPSSLDVLHRLAEAAPGLALLAVVTFRADFAPPWAGEAHVSQVALKRMSEAAIRALAAGAAGTGELPEEIFQHVIAKTDGVPLFVEELTKSLVESDVVARRGAGYELTGPLGALSVPDTLQESLMARLDRHAPIKEVAQIAAVIGREFDYDLLAAVAGLAEARLRDGLEQLVATELVYRRTSEASPTYIFKHALIQDTAYESLLRSRRQRIHAAIAAALEDRFPERVAGRPEVPAHHYTAAAMAEQAVVRWVEAGELAARRGAHDEAIGHFRSGLTVLTGVGDEEARLAATVRLNHGLAASMRVVDRLDEAFEALDAAEAAATRRGAAAELGEIHFLRGNLYFPLGRLDECLGEHERALGYARQTGSVECEARALGGLGDANYLRGRMLTAHTHFERCIELARAHAFDEIEVANTYMLGATCLYRGDCERGYRETERGAERAREVGHLRAEMVARGVMAFIGFELGWLAEMHVHIERALELSAQLDARRFQALQLCLLGWARASAGDLAGGLADLDEAWSHSQATSVSFTGPWILGAVARFAEDEPARRAALVEGERLLAAGCVSHCYFYFYRDAIEQAIERSEWEEAERYATALEDYTRAEPLPYTDFLVERARALVAHVREAPSGETRARLQALRETAGRCGFVRAAVAIDVALAGSPA